jgi:hypothetical protein
MTFAQPSEMIVEKAARLLVEGRLTVLRANPSEIAARCDGDHGSYVLGWRRDSYWSCSCPALRPCSHVAALRLVTGGNSEAGDGPGGFEGSH